MGMFDNIKYDVPCPICSAPFFGWQSKDAGCCLDTLTPAELWEQSESTGSVEFYSSCGKCGTSVDITLSPGLLDMTEDDFRRLRNREPSERRRGPVIPGSSDE